LVVGVAAKAPGVIVTGLVVLKSIENFLRSAVLAGGMGRIILFRSTAGIARGISALIAPTSSALPLLYRAEELRLILLGLRDI
jgi:hypothetical protein